MRTRTLRPIDVHARFLRLSFSIISFTLDVHTLDALDVHTHFVCLIRLRPLCAVVVQAHTCALDAHVHFAHTLRA